MDPATGTIADDSLIQQSLPTIKLLQSKGARVVLCSHRGVPKSYQPPNPKLSTLPLAVHLSSLLGTTVTHLETCVGDVVSAKTAEMADGDVVLLENVRFEGGERENDMGLAERLAADTHASVFVSECARIASKEYASTVGVAKYINGPKVAG
jgi:3-phosphoglycerate kinase